MYCFYFQHIYILTKKLLNFWDIARTVIVSNSEKNLYYCIQFLQLTSSEQVNTLLSLPSLLLAIPVTVYKPYCSYPGE